MRKLILLLVFIIFISSCSGDDPSYQAEVLPVNEAIVPSSFTFNRVDTITVRYTLPSNCYELPTAYYRHNGLTSRVVAVKALKNLDIRCSQLPSEMELKIPVLALYREDYYFSFWMGEDSRGNDLFQDFSVPVN